MSPPAPADATRFARLVVEKPIGHDLASAMAINDALAGAPDERQRFTTAASAWLAHLERLQPYGEQGKRSWVASGLRLGRRKPRQDSALPGGQRIGYPAPAKTPLL